MSDNDKTSEIAEKLDEQTLGATVDEDEDAPDYLLTLDDEHDDE